MRNKKVHLLHASPLVLFGALASAGFTTTVHAGFGGPAIQASHVSDSVTDNLNGTFDYGYTVHNDGVPGFDGGENFIEPIIRDWELPYFGDAGITDIISPVGWDWAIETIGTENLATGWEGVAAWQDPSDPFYFGDDSPFTDVTQVLHWYTNDPILFGIYTGFEGINFLGGFGFTAAFDETAAPYQASWFNLPIQSGDPAFPLGGIPASPSAVGPTIPEPETLALMTFGLVGWSAARKKRKTDN